MSRQQTAWIDQAIQDAQPATHWAPAMRDEAPILGQYRAACGAKVDEQHCTTAPTCPRCAVLYRQCERMEP